LKSLQKLAYISDLLRHFFATPNEVATHDSLRSPDLYILQLFTHCSCIA